jgi:endonuclease-3
VTAPAPPPAPGRDAPAIDRAGPVLDALAAALPDARIALDFADRWQLLVATMLSAQSTDARVNLVTPALFARFPDAASTAAAAQEDLEALIATVGLFRAKARNLRATAALVVERHGGAVPGTMEELCALPGVARKTANVVLANGFDRFEGIAVDTHVGRLARRLGLSTGRDAVAVERDLMALVPRERWLEVSDLLIHHGRRTCLARTPDCATCVVEPWCPSSRAAGRGDAA